MELTQWEIDWAQDRLISPPIDVTIEEVEEALADAPFDAELQQLHTLVQLQSLSC